MTHHPVSPCAYRYWRYAIEQTKVLSRTWSPVDEPDIAPPMTSSSHTESIDKGKGNFTAMLNLGPTTAVTLYHSVLEGNDDRPVTRKSIGKRSARSRSPSHSPSRSLPNFKQSHRRLSKRVRVGKLRVRSCITTYSLSDCIKSHSFRPRMSTEILPLGT